MTVGSKQIAQIKAIMTDGLVLLNLFAVTMNAIAVIVGTTFLVPINFGFMIISTVSLAFRINKVNEEFERKYVQEFDLRDGGVVRTAQPVQPVQEEQKFCIVKD